MNRLMSSVQWPLHSGMSKGGRRRGAVIKEIMAIKIQSLCVHIPQNVPCLTLHCFTAEREAELPGIMSFLTLKIRITAAEN